VNGWRPNSIPQELALRKKCFEILYGGARGGGKTDAGLAWLLKTIENPYFRGLVIRKNADDLSDWIDRANKMYARYGAKIAYRPAVITFPSGAVIKSGHLKDDQAYTKYQGHEYQRMLIEELTQIPNEKRYIELLSSCRSTVPGLDARFFGTTNPGGIGHSWVKKRFIDVAPPNTEFVDPSTGRSRIFIPARVDDNVDLMRHDPSYVNFLEGLKGTDEMLWKAWRMGSWDVFVGQTFSEFIYDLHVTDRFDYPLESCKKIIGFDWGYNHAGSAQFIAVCPENNWGVSRLYSYREIHQNKTTPEQWADQIAIFCRLDKIEFIVLPHDCFSDREGKESIADIFKRVIQPTGCRVIRGDTLSRGARVNRVALTHQNLSMAPDGKPYWQIHPKCSSLIETLPVMVYSDTNPEDVEKVDGDDDYDSVSLGLKTIQATWNINSAPIRMKKPNPKAQPWGQVGNQITSVDFMAKYKQGIKKRSAEKSL
jgi:hypothetical protein